MNDPSASAPSSPDPPPLGTPELAAAPVWKSPVVLLALALVLLRLAYLAFPDLFPEEAYYWLYARHLDYGYLDHPPMVAWLIALGTAAFGDTGFGVRILAFACSLVTALFAFRLTALLYGRRAAPYALLAVQILPFFFMVGFVMTPDAPLTACWSGLLYFLAGAMFRPHPRAWLGVGVCLGLGMLSKYTIALLGPATLLFLALDPASRFWFRRAAPYLGVAVSILIFSPVIWWNEAHHWASFAFQTTGRTRVHRHFALHELAGSILAVLTPLPLYLAARSLFTRPAGPEYLESDQPPPPSASNHSNLDSAPAMIDPARRRLFARVFTLVPLSVFVLFSLAHRVKLNWTGPLWLAVIPVVAAQLAAATRRHPATPGSRPLRFFWNATVAVCALAYLGCLHHLAFGIPGIRYSRDLELLPVGWSDLAKALEQQKAGLRLASDAPIYIVGMDKNFIASEASFYQSDRATSLRETTGAHLFGADSLMFRYWFPPAILNGSTLLLVAFDAHDLEPSRLKNQYREVGPIQKELLSHEGKPIRSYYTRVAYGYQAR